MNTDSFKAMGLYSETLVNNKKIQCDIVLQEIDHTDY